MASEERTVKGRFDHFWPAASSAILVLLAFPPLNLSFLVFVALVPWLLYLAKQDGSRGFRSGYLFGFCFWLGELSFIAQFVARWTQSTVLGLVPYLLGCLVAATYFGLFGWVAGLCYKRSLSWAIPVVWAGVEVFRSYVVALAFPYGLLAMPLTSSPAIIQSAHYGSVFFTSGWVVLCNITIVEIVKHRSFVRVKWHLAAFAAVLALSLFRYSSPSEGSLRQVTAGQPGVNLAYGDTTTMDARVAAAVDRISRDAAGSDLLVLPEGIVKAGADMPPPIEFGVSPSLPVVFGGQRGTGPAFQSAFSYDGHWGFADKTRLVIFGEYVPLRHHLPFLESFNLPGGDLVPADRISELKVGKFNVGAALCFEALFPDVPYKHALNGSNLIAVMSVDDWYFGTTAPEQLRDASNWRAIETGLPVVRAASMGYSIIVDARGRTVASAPLSDRHTLIGSVRVPSTADLFVLFPLFPYSALLSLLIIPLYDALTRLRAKRNTV